MTDEQQYERPPNVELPSNTSPLAKQYVELFRFEAPEVPIFGARRDSIWASVIPRIVPSVATYGAYEQPI